MTDIAICHHQGLFFTVKLDQINESGAFKYRVELIAHREEDWANNQNMHYMTLTDAYDKFCLATKNIERADREIAEYIPGERERIEQNWEDAWQEEDRTTGQRVRDALQAQLNQQ